MILNINSQTHHQLIDITEKIENCVKKSKINRGICLVFTPHSTCAVVLTENEERLKNDWTTFLLKQVEELDFQHNQIDNNADSHILAGILGQEKIIPIENNQLQLGTWQQIFLVELDGPRERKVVVKVIKE